MSKFIKDIENIKKSRLFRIEENDDYSEPHLRDDRIFINLYFIEAQLKTIKWILVVIATILFSILLSQ
jgi:hypothetical protein